MNKLKKLRRIVRQLQPEYQQENEELKNKVEELKNNLEEAKNSEPEVKEVVKEVEVEKECGCGSCICKNLEDYTKDDLKNLLEIHDMNVSGTKSELVERLRGIGDE